MPFHIARTRAEEFGRGIPYILVIHRAVVKDGGQLRLAQLGSNVTQSPIFIVMLCKKCMLVEGDGMHTVKSIRESIASGY